MKGTTVSGRLCGELLRCENISEKSLTLNRVFIIDSQHYSVSCEVRVLFGRKFFPMPGKSFSQQFCDDVAIRPTF